MISVERHAYLFASSWNTMADYGSVGNKKNITIFALFSPENQVHEDITQ